MKVENQNIVGIYSVAKNSMVANYTKFLRCFKNAFFVEREEKL